MSTGWAKRPQALFGRPLLEIFILDHYNFSMVPDVSTPEKHDSVVKIFITCIFLFKIEKTRFFVFFHFQHDYLYFRVCLFISCILLRHSSYHCPPEFISMKTQDLVCESSVRFLGTTDCQPNLPEFAAFTTDLRKSQLFMQLKGFDQRIYICTCARYTGIYRRPSKSCHTSIELLQDEWFSQ